MREPLSLDDYIEMDLDGARSTQEDHRALAEALTTWAERPHPESELTSGQLWVLAGERFLMLRDTDRAEECLTAALTTGDWGDGLDPRCFLVDLCLRQDRREEALEHDGTMRRSRPEGIKNYHYMTELWHEHEDLRRALGWANRGLAANEDAPVFDNIGEELLCLARWSVRQAQGQEPDEYDEVAITMQEEFSESGRGG